jgi:hypothetical protein
MISPFGNLVFGDKPYNLMTVSYRFIMCKTLSLRLQDSKFILRRFKKKAISCWFFLPYSEKVCRMSIDSTNTEKKKSFSFSCSYKKNGKNSQDYNISLLTLTINNWWHIKLFGLLQSKTYTTTFKHVSCSITYWTFSLYFQLSWYSNHFTFSSSYL